MTYKLKDIASINTGFYKKPDPEGNATYLQGKHFDMTGKLKGDVVLSYDVWIDERAEKHVLRNQDLLFVAKGENNRTCMYYEHYGKAVASSLFFVIRINQYDLLPEYLHWFMNTPSTQKRIERFSKGSHIPSVSKKSLRELEVQIPPINIQEKILEVDQVWQKEKEITHQILTQKELYYHNLLIELAKEKSK